MNFSINNSIPVFRKPKNQAGASIVEMLIVATILLIVVGAAVGLLSHLITSTSIGAEKQDLEKGKETLGTIVRPDIENAGFGIAGYQNHTYGSAAAVFESNAEYQALGGGDIVRTNGNTGSLTSLTIIGSQTGSVNATMYGASRISLTGELGGTASLNVEAVTSNTFKVSLEAGTIVTELGIHQSGTIYRINLVPSATGKALIVSRIDGGGGGSETELGRTTDGVPSGTIGVSAFISAVGDRMQIRMTGAPLIQNGASTTLRAMLFTDYGSGDEIDTPVYQNPSDGSAVLISGDPKVGLSYLKQPVGDLRDETQIIASKSEKSPIQVGDYCLLINYGIGTSALLQIKAIEDEYSTLNSGVTKKFTVKAVKSDAPAWNRFYSTDGNLTQAYAEGSRLVKLNPPVIYRISGDKRLIRQVGDKAETAAFNVQNFTFSSLPANAGEAEQYEIAIEVAADGRHTRQGAVVPVVRYVYRATPKALNAANQTE